jgi:hypothetical protein
MTLLIIGATPVQGNAIDFSQQKFGNNQGTPCEQLDQVITGDDWTYKCVLGANQELLWQKNQYLGGRQPLCNVGEQKPIEGFIYKCTKKGVGEVYWKKIRKFNWNDKQPVSQEVKKLKENSKKVNDVRNNMKNTKKLPKK